MGEDVLHRISKLEGVHIPQAELDVGIDDKLGETENLSTQMEGISESRLFAFLGGQRLDGFQIEILENHEIRGRLRTSPGTTYVVQVQVVEVLDIRLLEKMIIQDAGNR